MIRKKREAYVVSLLEAAIVGNVFSLSVEAVQVDPDLLNLVVRVLVDDALCFSVKSENKH